MEFFVVIALIIMALSFLFKELSEFVKRLHSSKPKGLLSDGKILQLNITLSSRDRKKEVPGPTKPKTSKR